MSYVTFGPLKISVRVPQDLTFVNQTGGHHELTTSPIFESVLQESAAQYTMSFCIIKN